MKNLSARAAVLGGFLVAFAANLGACGWMCDCPPAERLYLPEVASLAFETLRETDDTWETLEWEASSWSDVLAGEIELDDGAITVRYETAGASYRAHFTQTDRYVP